MFEDVRAIRQPLQSARSRRLPVLLAVGTIALVLIATIIVGISISHGEHIFPNVIAEGVPIGGLTIPEAAEKLRSDGALNLTGRKVEVQFPGGVNLIITAEDADVKRDLIELVSRAHAHGRDGNIVSTIAAYIGASFNDTIVEGDDLISIDERYIRAEISALGHDIRERTSDSGVVIGANSIELIKGAQRLVIDEDEVYSMVEAAFKAEEPSLAPLRYTPPLDENGTVDFESLLDSIYTEAVDATYNSATGGILPGKMGMGFDVSEAQRLWGAAKVGDIVEIPLTLTPPTVTEADLDGAVFRDLLAQKSTTLAGSSGSRINNITLAAAAIDGTILNPGEEFSYNGVVGQRTAAGGFQAAGAYSNGQVVNEIGGGICQVSSTLYYCSLIANLTTVDRTCHMFAVNYLPSGLDATVSWPGPDFVFRNDRDFPVKIVAGTDLTNLTVTVSIYGTDIDGSYVKLETETWATGSGTGAVSYRLLYDRNDQLISKEEESRSSYRYHTATPSASNAPNAPELEPPPADATPDPNVAVDPVEPPPVVNPPSDGGQTPVEPPPVVQPPVDQPPVEQPPVDQPPIEQPPVVEQPPVEQPPVEQPPVVEPPPVIEQPPAPPVYEAPPPVEAPPPPPPETE